MTVKFNNVGGDPFQDEETLADFINALLEAGADRVLLGDEEWPDVEGIHDRPVIAEGISEDEAEAVWADFQEDAVAIGAPKQAEEGGNPGGNAPETGKQDSLQLIQVFGQDGEFDGELIGVGVDFPNSGVYVDWLNEKWPDDQQLDEPHVSDYGTVGDLEQATGNRVEMADNVHVDELEEKLEVLKASGVPGNAVRVEDQSEIPDDAQKIEGPRGGTYYVAGAGDADMDELQDAMESVAEGNPAAEGQVDAILTHAENPEQVMEAVQEMHPDMQEEIFNELDDDEQSRPEPGDTLTADEWDQLEEGDVVEGQKPGFGPVKGPIVDLDSDASMQSEGDQVLLVENEYQDGLTAEIGSESHGQVEVQETVGGDDSTTSYTEADNVSESVPEPPGDVIEQWEEQHSDALEQEAAAHDMDTEEYKAAVSEEYARVMENAQPAVRAPSGLLETILDDGRIKNQHETGSSGGWLDPDMRRDFEQDFMGVSEDTPDEEMPIYGFASSEDAAPSEEPDDLDGYGDASIRLDDSAKESASVTFGDSLSANGGMGGRDEDSPTSFAATPANNPGAESVEPGLIPAGHDEDTQLEMLENADDPTDLSMYNEMQFHGGIDADQIEEVKFDANADFRDPPDQELLDRLDEAGISYEVEE
jgi:hypothetical protein